MSRQTSQGRQSGRSPSSLFREFESVKIAVLDILNNTTWPPEANNISQYFSQTIADASKLKSVPGDDATMSKSARKSLRHLIQVMEAVKPKLEKISSTYGERDRGLGGALVHSLKSLNRSRCPETLGTYLREVEAALALLPDPDDWIRQPKSSELTSKWISQLGKGPNSSTGAIKASTPQPFFTPLANEQKRDSTSSIHAVQQASPSRVEKRDDKGKWLGPIKTTLDAVEGVSGTVPVVGSYIGAAVKVGKIVVQTMQNMESNESACLELETHAFQLSQALGTISGRRATERRMEIEAALRNAQRALQDVWRTTKRIDSENAFKKALFADDHREALKNQKEKVRTALEVMKLLLQLDTTKLVTELYDSESRNEQQRLLDRLGIAEYGIRGASIQDAICLPGTRTTTLERMHAWIRSRDSKKRVLWIRGMAGRGKSTVASTVLEEWRTHAACAIFHFRRGQNTRDRLLVCALARQLGCSHLVPELKNSILGSIRENQDIAQERLYSQFQTLLAAPLSQFKDPSTPVLLIVDALDECEDENFAVEFVKLIDHYSSSWPTNIKFLLTTRPQAPLLRALEPRQWSVEDLDSTPEGESHRDIDTYLKRSLSAVGEEHGLGHDWPPPQSIQVLVQLSEGLFQWANTAIKYVGQGLPEVRLRNLLHSSSDYKGLDAIYRHVLSQALNKAARTNTTADLFLRVLRALVIAPHPISLDALSYVLADHPMLSTCASSISPSEIIRSEALGDLRSMVHVPFLTSDPVRLLHTSIRDLLTDVDRCAGVAYFVDPPSQHLHLALKCLALMQKDLKTNICQLSDLSRPNSDQEVQKLVRDKLPQGLQYCCRSLSLHLTATSTNLNSHLLELAEPIRSFSEEKLLGWLEVMSVTEKTVEAMSAAKQIYEWVQKYSDSIVDPSVTALWGHLKRFIATYFEPIHFGALHIYASALPVCPTTTSIWKQYGKMAAARILNGPRRMIWPSTTWARYSCGEVLTVTFSTDGKRLASGGSGDGTIRMWDAQTGAPIGEPLRGHTHSVTALAFSPDGKRLASASDDETIRMWDARTGATIGEPLSGHTRSVNTLAFSPDGKRLASGSDDKTIRVWDAETGSPIRESLRGHTWSINSVVFAPDGKRLASGSGDKTIRMWDPETGAPIGEPLRGHTGSVKTLAFSPDNKHLGSGSDDKTIRVWDAERRAPIGEPLRGHTGIVNTLAFSPEGKLLASGSGDKTVRIWNGETGAPIGEPMRGHTGIVNTLAFSPDGGCLASGSDDETIRMWDARTGATIGEPLRGHTWYVNALAFSPDGKRLASGSSDKTIRMWDAQTGEPVGEKLKGHTGSINTLAFSPDGKRLASGSDDETIRMWDAKSGARIGEPLRGHTWYINTLAFAPDGKRLASGSSDKTIWIWNPATGAPIGEPLKGHTHSVNALAFSPDGKRLVSGSDDETIRMWDARTGAPIGEPLRGHTWYVNTLTFSPDGNRLVSGSRDETIRMWDAKTRAPIGEPVRGHTGLIITLVFSPNGKRLASGSGDKTLRIWDAQTGATIGEPLRGHTQAVTTLAFSLDGKCLTSASDDETIRMWDAETGAPIGEPLTGHRPVTSVSPNSLFSNSVPHLRPVGQAVLGYLHESIFSSSSQLTLSSEGQWVTNLGKRILWLPPEYWGAQEQIILLSRGTLALSHNKHLYISDLSGITNMLP